MDNFTVKSNVIRFVYPFQYYPKNKSKENTEFNNPYKVSKGNEIFNKVNKLFGNKKSGWLEKPLSEANYIFPYVEDFFSKKKGNNSNAFSKRFEVNKNIFKVDKLFNYFVNHGGKSYIFELKIPKNGSIAFYNFQSEIGILTIDIEIVPMDNLRTSQNFDEKYRKYFVREVTPRIISFFNKRFQNLRADKNFLLLPCGGYETNPKLEKEFSSWIKEKKQEHFSFIKPNDFINRLLEPAKNEVEIMPMLRNHLIGYGFVFMETGDNKEDWENTYEQIKKDFYHLRNFNDEKYLPTKKSLELRDNPGIYHPHGNIFWGFSMFGGVALVFKNESSFINEQFGSRVFNEYFKIFLLVLHQNLLLTKTGQIISHFARNDLKGKNLKKIVNEINEIRNKFLKIISQSWFPVISSNIMYNEVYSRWRNTFRVEEMYEDISNKIRELDEYLDRYYQKFIEQRTKRLETLGIIALPLTILTGFWGMNILEVSNNGFSVFSTLSIVVNSLFIFFTVILIYVLRIKDKK